MGRHRHLLSQITMFSKTNLNLVRKFLHDNIQNLAHYLSNSLDLSITFSFCYRCFRHISGYLQRVYTGITGVDQYRKRSCVANSPIITNTGNNVGFNGNYQVTGNTIIINYIDQYFHLPSTITKYV